MPEKIRRCSWVEGKSELYIRYHDEEWGVSLHDDEKLFEMLLLECFQAGLSWITILNKREAFRAAFDGFDREKIVGYGEDKIEELMQNTGIIRNRGKICAAVANARIYGEIQQEYGSFADYLWGFTDGQVIRNQDDQFRDRTALSDAVSQDLKRRGMKYVGSVTIYSYLQAAGVVNDHAMNCACYLAPISGTIHG